MNRRDFIKNTAFCVGCSGVVGGMSLIFNNSDERTIINGMFEGIDLKKEYLTEKYKYKMDLPSKIRLETCTLCQLNCVCCPRRDPSFKKTYGLGYLKFKNFKKFVDDNLFNEIEISNKGEIFLNPELLDIIKYAHQKDIKLTAYNGVNMNYLPDNIAEALVKYKFSKMVVSIDGATPETYAIYRQGGDFNTVINNIEKINFYKKKYNSIYPMMSYKFILFGHNEHEIDEAKEMAKKLDMEMIFASNYEQSYSPVKNLKLIQEKTGLCANIPRADLKDFWYLCKQLWIDPQINWDGKLFGCCRQSQIFGSNVFKDGLLNALNAPYFIYEKNMLLGKAKPIKSIPCFNCDTYINAKRMGIKLSHLEIFS